ncbi:MAG: dihydroneopterin aldolase [Flavobacteriales bacterium]|nr:dihydroneopterin aldolase [Flavobacteriales bacterium]|tara:strand:+ start:21907 stop:22275 length:369 start_codon:yes stop_codon:yes gene_type:complete
MATISALGIRAYAYHGCLPEETKIGSDYEVNVVVDFDIKKSSVSDKLQHTVDYVSINTIVKKEMARPSKLLEHVVTRILAKIIEKYPNISNVEVSVAKQNPPINGDVREVVVKDKRIKGIDF